MATTVKITDLFDANLAELLTEKITRVDGKFDGASFTARIGERVQGKTYTQRIEVIAEELRAHLPQHYEAALRVLCAIMGPENPNQTGMFSQYYWLMPVGKFIEKYGLGHFDVSMRAIGELTKRNTGEYAVRPYIRANPQESLAWMEAWARSDNFHLRRLASEGLRPKLPWAPKLDTFVTNPAPVFAILELLKQDEVLFVKKSVANHLTDYLKVNPEPTRVLIAKWRQDPNENTQWILARATRKIS